MMNEKGFMYPVTLCIFMLFSVFLMIQFNQFLTDKKILTEIEYNEKKQFYFLQSLKKMEELLSGQPYEMEGEFLYHDGRVLYSVEQLGENILQIRFEVCIGERDGIMACAYYDSDLRKIFKWVEMG